MFRSSTIIREPALNLLYAVQNATLSHFAQHTTHTPLYDMLPHNRIISNYTECFNIDITLARFSAGSLMMVEDRNM